MKAEDNDHITGQHQGGSQHQECNLNLSVSEKTYLSYNLIFQEIGKYNFKIKKCSRKTQKYLSFAIQQLKKKKK